MNKKILAACMLFLGCGPVETLVDSPQDPVQEPFIETANGYTPSLERAKGPVPVVLVDGTVLDVTLERPNIGDPPISPSQNKPGNGPKCEKMPDHAKTKWCTP